jgi:hypothetical protein
MYVSNCNFIGTDIGMRFKTNRGRGGMVENIYASGINMKDIIAEAISFDMYYMAKDPVVLAGENREPPKVEMMPVNETTPQFRNFHLSDITCNGASKGIFIRGIPEMHVKDIWITRATLQADKGIDIQEASNINLSNVSMYSKDTNPVVYVLNSDNINLNSLAFRDSADLLLQVQGERTKDIRLMNTNSSSAKKQLLSGYGATDGVVNWSAQPPAETKKTNKKEKKAN